MGKYMRNFVLTPVVGILPLLVALTVAKKLLIVFIHLGMFVKRNTETKVVLGNMHH